MPVVGGPDLEQVRRLVTPIPGPRSIEMQKRRSEIVAASIGTTLPIFVQQAGGGVLVDVDNNSLIDLASGIAVTSVGNSAPHVVANVQEQVSQFTHTCFMITEYEGYVAVCEQLNRITPGDHAKRSALFNSGAEAVENAVKIARSFTGRSGIAVVEHAYHGRTNLTMGMTAKHNPYKKNFGPFTSDIHRIPNSYPLRDGRTGAEAAEHAIRRLTIEGGVDEIAAIVIEPIQGEGGFIVPAPGFLAALSKFATANGILLVADEIQTGIARTGEWFACDHEGVVPDLITTAKALAGGLPLAGVTGRAEIMDSVHVGGIGGTYGGNPVCCAAALGAIATIEELDLIGAARRIENIMVPLLTEIALRTGVIAEVRGRGALLAVEITKPGTLDPDPELTKKVVAYCHSQGVLVLSAGSYANVLRLLPPLVIGEDLLREAVGVLSDAFDASI